MRKFTSILCSMMFAIFGIGLALHETTNDNQNGAFAATLPTIAMNMPTGSKMSMPLDLLLDQAKKQGVQEVINTPKINTDSLQSRITELEKKVKATRTKLTATKKRARVNRTRGDTIYVDRPVYYLAKMTCCEDDTSVEYYTVTKLDSIPH